MKLKKPNLSNSNDTNEPNELVLNNTANYNPVIMHSFTDITVVFLNIVFEYIYTITETANMKNKKYYSFIFKRGLETIIHIFTLLFYYTKNLELTMKYTKSALYEYVEFIDQMSDDKVTFLRLTSRDAVLFVYKKSIFEINNEYRKNMKEPAGEEKALLTVLSTYINICKNAILFISHYGTFDKPIINECYNCVKNIGDNVSKVKAELIEYINIFVVVLNDLKIKNPNTLSVEQYLELLNQFTKMIGKKKVNENFKTNIYDLELMNCKEISDIINFIFD